jgi:hypothetical protein
MFLTVNTVAYTVSLSLYMYVCVYIIICIIICTPHKILECSNKGRDNQDIYSTHMLVEKHKVLVGKYREVILDT